MLSIILDAVHASLYFPMLYFVHYTYYMSSYICPHAFYSLLHYFISVMLYIQIFYSKRIIR